MLLRTPFFYSKVLLFTVALCLFGFTLVTAQKRSEDEAVRETINAFDTLHQRLPVEKIYMQLDKPYYALGDTIWFKGYLLNADSLKKSDRSGVLYTELANDKNEVIQRISSPVVGGMCWGDLPLDSALFSSGSYTLRAYTNWMLNLGQDGIFEKHFDIVSSHHDAWLATMRLQEQSDKASVHLQLQNTLHQPVSNQDVKIRLLNDAKTLHRNTFTTDAAGHLDLDFDIPSGKLDKLALQIDGDSLHHLKIPLLFHRPQDIDLQFMPEGGDLLAGQTQRIGFKAIGEDGKGLQVAGDVYNSIGEKVAAFQSFHDGMGSFSLKAVRGEKYIARLSVPDSVEKTFALPEVQSSGTFLQVQRLAGQDSLQIKVGATADIIAKQPAFLLLAQSPGNELLYSKQVQPTVNGILLNIPTQLFPTGVARFTLMDMQEHPLNERLVFIHHPGNLQIAMNTDQPAYHPRDSIALHVEVKDASGNPVFGNFSLAVTDDNQVKLDPNAENIISYFHLSSCLKGFIEDPFYYFSESDTTGRALDNLLLTQGWVGYDWKTVFDPPKTPAYQPEKAFVVNGKVVNGINKPLKNTRVSLVSQKPAFVRETKTDRDGQFVFKNFPPIDSPNFFIQALNRQGKSFNVGIEINEFKPPQLKSLDLPASLPWNVNMDTTISTYLSKTQEHQDEVLATQMAGHLLKTVEVKAKKAIHNSHNINGPGEADIVLDENDIRKAGNISLYDFLRQHIPGLNIDINASLNGYDVHIIIEGMTLEYISDFKVDPLTSLTTHDIRGIEVMYSPRYTNSYNARFAVPRDIGKRDSVKRPIAYIEITTMKETTLWEQKKPGVYVYTPVPFTWPKKFYRPGYTVKTIQRDHPDLRSTIHWEPNVEMETKGKALVTFYAADHPGTYTIIMEGSDMNGHLGYHEQKIKIEAQQ